MRKSILIIMALLAVIGGSLLSGCSSEGGGTTLTSKDAQPAATDGPEGQKTKVPGGKMMAPTPP